MAQVLEFTLPDLGEGLTEAEIVRWLVDVGEVVAVDQPVVEVETAKAMVEVPCPYAGVVTARFGAEGAELPVGAPLLTVAVGASETAEPAAASGASGASSAGERQSGESGPETQESGNVLVGYGTTAPPVRRRRVRAQGPASAREATAGDGPAGSVSPAVAAEAGSDLPSDLPTDRAVHAVRRPEDSAGAADTADIAASEGPVPVISPLVRRLAREHGLDLRELNGSGPDGLILRADVEYALRAAGSPARSTAADRPAAPAQAPAATDADTVRVPLKGVRGAVADKLARSRREIPDATCWVDADATELLRTRAVMNAAGGPKISVLALFARICVAALDRHPELNSMVDTEAREVVRLDRVHLGFAAQTDRGLMVPVVRDAHGLGAESLSTEFARLTEAAREGRLSPAELTGGTFTLNNYGVFGVDGSTPIINHPEAAMLGVGRIAQKPWVHDGELAVRQVVQLSLTFDHRVCDGGTAGGFLRYVADCVEQPSVLLRTL
ncbi:2-oxo acid dehydrogenase subunit E2 [Streptomyces triticagri]|uniref:Dihydrolipoamide acetyltransferase component of pyruvate dehydrogenase complex n=1 Tax=Streptomyces triticagri TaxID=2293568 RepID=A0A372M384_9ACTN|nr:dihydrolipoamide acetyltransferase family protein [Streptomyces triticagri]RFU85100.1 2-oxo acid dehydrogenase subunit E2 [Streptomyces triticagri]